MPSFDVVSEVDKHEVTNAVDQASREMGTRFDFKGVDASFEQDGLSILITAEAEFQVDQLQDILHSKLFKRGVDVACIEAGEIEHVGKQFKRAITLREGIDQPLAKKIVKQIKDAKLKVQAAIQGDKVRVTGKKRDDLQQAIALLKGAELDMPLQYNNFRD